MNFEPLEKIANAALYEGYMLYPYRSSAHKNQQRWHFGNVGPPGGEDPDVMQTECLVQSEGAALLDLKIRFLQGDAEREITVNGIRLEDQPQIRPIVFEPIRSSLEFSSEPVAPGICKLRVRIQNQSTESGAAASMLSTHTMLAVHDGAFISLLDPPDDLKPLTTACQNIRTWPVLGGAEGDRHLLLSSPIILYDYPQIAPESAGDFFDGTEMDEMLTLRVLTLSDEEKLEVRSGDSRARQILERTEALPPEHLARLHGAIRGLRSSSRLEYRPGDRVRLHPRKRADIFDIALSGMVAIVESVECDFENRVHLAVTIEDDPGREFGVARQIGHRFFFSPEEVELL